MRPELPRQFPVDPLNVTRGVFEILSEHLDEGEFNKVMNHPPASIRDLNG
jgi:uncharacterized protein (DUF2267 family)